MSNKKIAEPVNDWELVAKDTHPQNVHSSIECPAQAGTTTQAVEPRECSDKEYWGQQKLNGIGLG